MDWQQNDQFKLSSTFATHKAHPFSLLTNIYKNPPLVQIVDITFKKWNRVKDHF